MVGVSGNTYVALLGADSRICLKQHVEFFCNFHPLFSPDCLLDGVSI